MQSPDRFLVGVRFADFNLDCSRPGDEILIRLRPAAQVVIDEHGLDPAFTGFLRVAAAAIGERGQDDSRLGSRRRWPGRGPNAVQVSRSLSLPARWRSRKPSASHRVLVCVFASRSRRPAGADRMQRFLARAGDGQAHAFVGGLGP